MRNFGDWQPAANAKRVLYVSFVLGVLCYRVVAAAGAPSSPAEPERSTFTGSLQDAAQLLQRQFHVQVDVAWEALAEAGVNNKSQVREMSRKSLDDALRAILHAAGANACTVTTPGHILLTTRMALARPRPRPIQAEPDREQAITAAMSERPAEADIANLSEESLDKRVNELQLDGVTFEEALRALADATQTNIVVHWRELQEAGIERKQPIRVHPWDVSVRAALRVMFEIIEDGNTQRIGFEVEDNIISVGTPESLAHAVTQLYNVEDLIEKGMEKRRRATQPIDDVAERQETVDEFIKLLTDTRRLRLLA